MSNPTFFQDKKTYLVKPPAFSKKINVANVSHSIVQEMKFPWHISEMIQKTNYARISGLYIKYIPDITITQHGVIRIFLKDQRKMVEREQNIMILETPGSVFTQFEVRNLEQCNKSQKNPITLTVAVDLKGVTPNAIIGKIEVKAVFSYSKKPYLKLTPEVSVNKISAEGYEIRKSDYDEETLLRFGVYPLETVA